jgi:hypothetical protein
MTFLHAIRWILATRLTPLRKNDKGQLRRFHGVFVPPSRGSMDSRMIGEG